MALWGVWSDDGNLTPKGAWTSQKKPNGIWLLIIDLQAVRIRNASAVRWVLLATNAPMASFGSGHSGFAVLPITTPANVSDDRCQLNCWANLNYWAKPAWNIPKLLFCLTAGITRTSLQQNCKNSLKLLCTKGQVWTRTLSQTKAEKIAQGQSDLSPVATDGVIERLNAWMNVVKFTGTWANARSHAPLSSIYVLLTHAQAVSVAYIPNGLCTGVTSIEVKESLTIWLNVCAKANRQLSKSAYTGACIGSNKRWHPASVPLPKRAANIGNSNSGYPYRDMGLDAMLENQEVRGFHNGQKMLMCCKRVGDCKLWSVQQWLSRAVGVEEHHAVYQMTRYRPKAKLKARPQNSKQQPGTTRGI